MKLFQFVILSPDIAANEVALNLVRDRNGFEIERDSTGEMITVASPKQVAKDLNLIPLVDIKINCLEPALA